MTSKGNQDERDVSLLAIDQYMRYVRRIQKASYEQQAQWLRQVEAGKQERLKPHPDQGILEQAQVARERLVDEYQSLVIGIAKRQVRRCRHLELLDLIQEGNLGLLQAVECHDASQSESFAGLVAHCVTWAIMEACSYRERLVRHSRYMDHVLGGLEDVEQRLCMEGEGEPTLEERAQAIGVSPERVRQLLVWRAQEVVLSLQALLPDKDAEDRLDLVPLFAVAVAGDEVRQEQLAQALRQAIEQVLRTNERHVLLLRYGLEAEPHSQSEVARALGFGARSVQRIEARAKSRLREALAPLYGRDEDGEGVA